MLTLLWQDEFAATEHPNQSRMQGPEKPLRLAIVQQGDVYQGTLSTRRLPWGVGFDSSACRVFEVDGREIPLHVPGGGPAMRGSVALDCQVGDRHVVAAVDFRNCAF